MKIEHVAAYFNDLEGAKAFFEQYFSASAGELYRNPRTGFCSYFLTFDGGARLEIMQKPLCRIRVMSTRRLASAAARGSVS